MESVACGSRTLQSAGWGPMFTRAWTCPRAVAAARRAALSLPQELNIRLVNTAVTLTATSHAGRLIERNGLLCCLIVRRLLGQPVLRLELVCVYYNPLAVKLALQLRGLCLGRHQLAFQHVTPLGLCARRREYPHGHIEKPGQKDESARRQHAESANQTTDKGP